MWKAVTARGLTNRMICRDKPDIDSVVLPAKRSSDVSYSTTIASLALPSFFGFLNPSVIPTY